MIGRMLQIVIAMVLFFVMMFGIGFILNMLMKTTWFPIYLFVIVLVPLYIWSTWDHAATFSANLAEFTFIDWLPVVAALVGAYVSGYAIRALRIGGYKMF